MMDVCTSSTNGKYVLLGEKYRDSLENGLISIEIIPIWLPNNPDVDPRLSGHADLSILQLGNKRCLAAPYLSKHSDFVKKLANIGIDLQFVSEQGRGYPQETGLNVCICGEHLICNVKTADQTAISLLNEYKIIKVKQGYTGCAVCVVNDHAVITADPGISAVLRINGFDVLEITPGYIHLDGYDYGFIGGAAFLLDETRLAFTGYIDTHPDAEHIHAFLEKHAVSPVFLSEEPIFDIGCAVVINDTNC